VNAAAAGILLNVSRQAPPTKTIEDAETPDAPAVEADEVSPEIVGDPEVAP
jgi:hypothetical protein